MASEAIGEGKIAEKTDKYYNLHNQLVEINGVDFVSFDGKIGFDNLSGFMQDKFQFFNNILLICSGEFGFSGFAVQRLNFDKLIECLSSNQLSFDLAILDHVTGKGVLTLDGEKYVNYKIIESY
jgi:hypothetical protein